MINNNNNSNEEEAGSCTYSSAHRRGSRMMLGLGVLAMLLLLLMGCGGAEAEIFTNSFLVKMKQPAKRDLADIIASRNGFVNLGPVSFFFCFIIYVIFIIIYVYICGAPLRFDELYFYTRIGGGEKPYSCV